MQAQTHTVRETFFDTNELLAANSKTVDETIEKLLSLDRGLKKTDKEAIERFVRSTYKAYLQEAPVFIKPEPENIAFIEPRIPFYSKNFIDGDLSSADGEPFILTGDILARYESLHPDKKALIDRLIGLNYLIRAHEKNELEKTNQDEYKKLDPEEKTYVEVLSKNFRGESIKHGEHAKLTSAFTYYNNLAKSRKATINLLILSKVFVKRNNKYTLDYSDAEAGRKLSDEELEIKDNIQRFRFQNERIITENQAVEALDYIEPPVDAISPARLPGTSEKTAKTTSSGSVNKQDQILIELPDYDYGGLKKIVMTGLLLDNTGKKAASRSLTLLKQDDTETSITTYTDKEGKFSFTIPSDLYKMVTEVKSDSISFVISNFKITGTSDLELFESNAVAYFDTNSDQLRPEAVLLLNEVIVQYKKDPMKIEIESHTDAIGNSVFNRKLSRRRGNTAFNYLISSGLKKSDISMIWHGFDQPIASNDSPYGRQLNRRMDIRLSGASRIPFDPGQYFLVRTNATLEAIAKSTGINIESIMEMNGLTSTELRKCQPLRIRSDKPLTVDIKLLMPYNSSLASGRVHIVQKGETLADIAGKFSVSENLLANENDLQSPQLNKGMELIIPPPKQK